MYNSNKKEQTLCVTLAYWVMHFDPAHLMHTITKDECTKLKAQAIGIIYLFHQCGLLLVCNLNT